MDAESWKSRKEDFVTGHNGTSLFEVTLISSFSPLLVLFRAIVLSFLPTRLITKHLFRFICDYFILIVPFVLIITKFASRVFEIFVILSLAIFTLLYFLTLYTTQSKPNNDVHACYVTSSYYKKFICNNQDWNKSDHLNKPAEGLKNSNVHLLRIMNSKLPFLQTYRFYINIATCLCILAVDFHAYPRRLAKAEDFGTGLMDLGVGAYVISNALVCSEARNVCRQPEMSKHISCLNVLALLYRLFSCWPLVLLGMLRLISIKASGYQEHISEYGIHWNFFFTLACVKILSSIILFFMNVRYSLLLSFILAMLYQMALTLPSYNLTSVLLNEEREGIFMQNKEGLASCAGYLSLYFAAVQLGCFLFRERSTLAQWHKVAKVLLCITILTWLSLFICIGWVQPVSRRLANLSYILWLLGHTTFFLFAYLVIDILVVRLVLKGVLPLHSMTDQWIMVSEKDLTKDIKIYFSPSMPTLSLINAVNRNQLLYFLLCNLLTGATNYAFDTLTIDNIFALVILCLYAFVGTFVAWCFHVNDITLKFW